MTPQETAGLLQEARRAPAPVTLVLTSVVSAGAAIADLDMWTQVATACPGSPTCRESRHPPGAEGPLRRVEGTA